MRRPGGRGCHPFVPPVASLAASRPAPPAASHPPRALGRTTPRGAGGGAARGPPPSPGAPPREPPVGVESPERGVTADRLVVHEDLRDGPAAGEVEELLPEARILVEKHLVV